MTYAAGRPILDCDAHIMETPGWLASYASSRLREHLPPMHQGDPELEALIAQSEANFARRSAVPEEARAAAEGFMTMPRKGWGALGDHDPTERKQVLDLLGFGAQLIFPTGSFPQVMQCEGAHFVPAVEAMNRGLAHFCEGDERLLSVAYIPFQRGPVAALQVLKQALADGAASVAVDVVPPVGGKSPTHPDFDPLWAAFVEHDLSVMLHVGLDNGWRPVRSEFFDNGRELAHFRSDAPGDALSFLGIGFGAELFIGALIYDGVLSRHPGLRFGVCELGATWVPSFLRFVDTAANSFRRMQDLSHLDRNPSEYVREQFCFSPFAGEDVGFMIQAGGAELFMFSSDYPHHEGTDDPIRRFERTMEDVSGPARDAFYYGNFARLLGSRAPA